MKGEILKVRYTIKDPDNNADDLHAVAEPENDEDAGGITLDMAGGNKFWFAWTQVPGLIDALGVAYRDHGPEKKPAEGGGSK